MDCHKAEKLILVGLAFFLFPLSARASQVNFNIDPAFDYQNRSQVPALLYQVGKHAYFFVEDEYYQGMEIEAKEKFALDLKTLSDEFDNVIYPGLTVAYGSEWKPGIDKDEKITILLTQVKSDSGGYFNEGDEYSKAHVASSNEREMLYFNIAYVGKDLAKSYLAHEFAHLITFNQKNRTYSVEDDVWLNEMRSELAPTLLGYDSLYEGSNLQKRVKTFSQRMGDSLTEWRNETMDYGVANLFGQYLLDHYGLSVLRDSLQTERVGIDSLNYALRKNNYPDSFSDVFTNWMITVFINDCSDSIKYCYLNSNLKGLKIVPKLNYLPSSGESSLTVTDYTKDWSGNWIKFVGGSGILEVEFVGEEKISFEVPYLLEDSQGKYSLNFLELNSLKRGNIFIKDFGTNYQSLILIPSSRQKMGDFESIESYRKFIWSASIANEDSKKADEETQLIAQLLARIDELKLEIARTQAKINEILNSRQGVSCKKFENNLALGSAGNEVKCLQEFLRKQGADIYPEGLATGNFLLLTQKAVVRFQNKYASDILAPLGLSQGTGVVGKATRAKINQLLGY